MTSLRTKESCLKKGIKRCPVCGSNDWYWRMMPYEPESCRCNKCGAEWQIATQKIIADIKARNFTWKDGK